jgi:predicted nucleic acid-binding protein
VKIVVNELGSKEAATSVATLLKRGSGLHTVDLAMAECLNAIWKHTNLHKDLSIEDGKAAIQDLKKVYDRLPVFTARELTEEAFDISLNQNMAVYDALYIAAAHKTDATLYTADRKLHEKATKIIRSRLLKT